MEETKETVVTVKELVKAINVFITASEYPVDYDALLTAVAQMKVKED